MSFFTNKAKYLLLGILLVVFLWVGGFGILSAVQMSHGEHQAGCTITLGEHVICAMNPYTNIDLKSFKNEFRFVSEKERRSVIIMCDVSNLNKFFDFLNKKYKLHLEYPPTHVTLYTLQPNAGIFLTDSENINKLSKPIEPLFEVNI